MLAMALPLVLAELGWMAMGIIDTIMVGRLPHAAVAIGAVSLGTALFYTCTIYGGALLLGLDTLISQAHGARNPDECHRSLWNALYLCVPVTAVLIVINIAIAASLPLLGVNPYVLPSATSYIRILNWGTPPLMLYFAFRRYLQGIGVVRPVM